MTFGGLLSRVGAIAKRRLPGWKPKIRPRSKDIAVVFCDLSAVMVSAMGVEIRVDGEEAQLFTDDYYAAWPTDQNENAAPQTEDDAPQTEDEAPEVEDYDGPEM